MATSDGSNEAELNELLILIWKLDGVVKDFLPNIGKCALQDYAEGGQS